MKTRPFLTQTVLYTLAIAVAFVIAGYAMNSVAGPPSL
jgi:hypothetical protein